MVVVMEKRRMAKGQDDLLPTEEQLGKQVWLWSRTLPATFLSLQTRGGRAMKVLLLAGLGALFFTYYWADNFDPGVCLGWDREESGQLLCAPSRLTTPAHCQLPSRDPVCC